MFTPPYEALAAGYDVVMEHVEYDVWTEYVVQIWRKHGGPDGCMPSTVLDLGCGTGAFGFALEDLWGGQYAGLDASAAMIAVARAKAEAYGSDLTFEVADFTAFRIDPPVDAALMLYDGLNYLLEPADIERALQAAYDALRPGGIFVFDQSTPANSVNNAEYFHDEGEAEGFVYVRTSEYDPSTRLHTTTFEMKVEGEPYLEQHVERAYDLGEVRAIIEASPFAIEAAYNELTFRPAHADTERIHWVARRPA
jgi:ubiquinone/menaquinone biosynthesis C-methylase UbiE